MESLEEIGIINVGLDATIRSQRTSNTIDCVVLNITKDYTDVMAVTVDPRVCKLGSVELNIPLPGNGSSIRCAGRVTWHLRVDELGEKHHKYLVRVFITDISQVNERKLDLLVRQKVALSGSGHTRIARHNGL